MMTDPDPLSSINTVSSSLSYDKRKGSLLGEGLSSTVRKGNYKGQEVAVKKLHKRTLETDDINLLKSIKHENIVKILDIEDDLENQFIVLERCLASLHQYFKNYETVSNKFSGLTVVEVKIIRDAVRGLKYLHLHEKGIVHRDIKPGNILLVQESSSSEVKAVLADFGISTKLNERDAVTTQRGRGTETWMAPELLLDDRRACKFSRESDIFSMGCVMYYVETGGNHPFDKGHDDDYTIHLNVKNYDPCDFRLLHGKPIATALIRKMIKRDRASRPSASEVLQDPYFQEDGPQDTIQVSQSQLTKGGEAPQGDTPQDISVVHDEASILPPEQSVSADEKGHASSSPPPEQSVTDTSYGEQLYDAMVNMSDSLPRYIVDHYIRLLAFANVKCDMKPDWPLSRRFLELYSTHVSHTSPQVAASYVYKILTGLGYEEMENFRAYLYTEVEIDTKITEELESIIEFRPAVMQVVRDELGPRLGDYQVERYRMVLTVLCGIAFDDSKKSFFELFTDLTGNLGKYPLAVALTIGVLERSGWGDTKKLKPFSLPNFDLNASHPEIDLCLTVADYYGNMSQRDFSSAKVYTSLVHLKGHNVSNMSRVQFTLLLMKRDVVKPGNISKIEDTVRYPIFFKEYKERCKGPRKETALPTDETVVPSLSGQETGATQETSQETEAQATSGHSQLTPTDQPGFITQKWNQFKSLFSSSSKQEAQALIQKYTKMRDEFNSLLLEVASEAKESLDEVKRCLLLIRQEANWKREVEAVTDEASLEELLQRYCFSSNFSLLKYIKKKLDLKESKSMIDQLAEERDAFYSEVLAEDFAAAAIEDHKMIKEHHVEMTVVVSWPSFEATLAKIQKCIAKEFKDDNLSMFIALRTVHHSDLTFMFTAPIWLEPAIGLALATITIGWGILYTTLNDERYEPVPAPIPPPESFPELDDLEFDPNFPDDLVKDINILLMTATDVELRGVLGYLEPLDDRDKVIKKFINTVYIYVGKYGEYSVVIGKSADGKGQQGPLDALTVTNKIMEIFKPKYIIAIGVCFGMYQSNVKLGDVIVSDFIVDLSDFRKETGKITPRKPQLPAGTTLSSFFGNTSKLKIKCSQEENSKVVKVHCGPIVSSPALVDDEELKKELGKLRSDALAGEMEGAAIFSAASEADHKSEAIVIKAVGDWGDGKKGEYRGWKDFASHAAATFVHYKLNNAAPDAFRDVSSDASLDASLYASPDIEEWLKEGMVDLTIKRVLMHGLPGSGKTCSQHLLLNEDPPKEDNSTGIACRAVKATRISAHDGHMERVDAKALLLKLAHDLKEAAGKQKKSPPTEDHSTEPMEEFSETTTTEPADTTESAARAKPRELVDESTDTTKSIEVAETTESADTTVNAADDTEAIKIRKDIVEAIPNAEGKKIDSNWVYIVDSGGQTAFQELLPLFTRASSLNIITLDLSKGIDDKLEQKYRINGELLSQIDENSAGDSKPFSYTNIQFLKDVLSSGAILQPYRAQQQIGSGENTSTESKTPQYPEYFVLGTHKDQDIKNNFEKYNEELSSLSSESEEKGYRIIPAVENSDTIIYAVNTMLESGSERAEEAKKLCRIIDNEVSGDKIPIPVRWFAFELTLLEKGCSFLEINVVLRAGESLQMTETETKEALEYLHNVTIILYYPQVLPDVVFVEPHPILDILSRLLALATYQIPREHLDHFVKKGEKLSDREKSDLKLRGIFTKTLLEKLKDDRDFPKLDFIKLLLHLHIIVETDVQGEYFIPSALPPHLKTSPHPKSSVDPLQIIWLSPEIKRDFQILPVPRGIFPLVIVNLMKRNRQPIFCFPPKGQKDLLRYRDAMSFHVRHQKNYNGTVHIIKKHNHIEIYFVGDASKYCSLIREAVKGAITSSCEAININPYGYKFAFTCPSTGCYRIVTNEDEKEVECTLPGSISPTNSGEEQHWSWFDKTQSSTEERVLDDDDSPKNADSSVPVQTNTDQEALSKTVSDVNTTTDNTAPAPTIANDGATNTVGAEEGQSSAQVNQPPTTGGGYTVYNIYNITNKDCQIQGQGNSTVSNSTQTSTNLFNSTNTVPAAEKEENESDDVTKGIKFLLMTATDPELKGVLKHLKPLDGHHEVIERFRNGVDLYIGKYGKCSVVVVQSAPTKSKQGSLPALVVTNKMMEIFKPKYIVAIGVCFGMDEKVNLGDVVVSDRIADLYNIRVEPGCIKARITDAVQAGDTLASIFRNSRNDIASLIRKSRSFKMMKPSFDKENSKEVEVHFGPMVSSPALVDDLEFKEKLREVRSDALAGEMEGAGIFCAARDADHKVDAIVVKAVGDLADGKKIEYKDWKPFACRAAAEYVLYHLNSDHASEL